MPALTYAQLEEAWIKGGGSRKMAALMAAIALAESSGEPDATNPFDNNGTQTSWGLWQISNGTHSPPDPNWADPVENARLAAGKLRSQGLTAWGTYVSGAYKKFLKGGVPPGVGTGLHGQQPPSGGGLFSLPSQITDFFRALEAPVQAAMWLIDPGNWARIVAGAAGFILLITGLIVLGRAA